VEKILDLPIESCSRFVIEEQTVALAVRASPMTAASPIKLAGIILARIVFFSRAAHFYEFLSFNASFLARLAGANMALGECLKPFNSIASPCLMAR